MKRGSRKRMSWVKGQSGNPGGRPKKPATIESRKIIEDVKTLAKELTLKAMKALEDVVTSERDSSSRSGGGCDGHPRSRLGQAEGDSRD